MRERERETEGASLPPSLDANRRLTAYLLDLGRLSTSSLARSTAPHTTSTYAWRLVAVRSSGPLRRTGQRFFVSRLFGEDRVAGGGRRGGSGTRKPHGPESERREINIEPREIHG